MSEIALLSHVYIQPFDQMAAIELAAMDLLARTKGSKRHPASPSSPWQKVKLDRQIVAIAKLHSAKVMYSDDDDVRKIADDIGIKAVSSWELPLPQSKTPLLDESGPAIDQN